MPKELNEIVSIPALIVLAGWLFRELYGFMKDKSNSHTLALKENSIEMNKLSIQMAKLEVKFESIEKLIVEIPRIKQDLNAFHAHKREVEKKLKSAEVQEHEQ